MIRRVFIKGYKSLKDMDVRFSPLTVILGPNASGKSNLLDALGLLSRIVAGPTIKAAFDDHRGAPLESFHIPSGGIEELMKQKALRLSLGVEVELSNEVVQHTEKLIQDLREGLPGPDSNGRSGRSQRIRERYLRYEVEIEFRTLTGHLRVINERLVALRKNDGRPTRRRKPFLDRDDQIHRLVLRMEGQSHPTHHELGLDYAIVSTTLYAPHYPHVTAFREELRRWKFYYFDPGVMRQESDLKAVDSLGQDGEDLSGFYHTLKVQDPQQFAGISDSLPIALPSAESIDTTITEQGHVRLIYKDSCSEYSSLVISDGTLRVLGLFAIMSSFNEASTIGFEEPENGVHPRRLSIIARLLTNTVMKDSETQVLVTTHSPRLPELLQRDFNNQEHHSQALIVTSSKRGAETRFEYLYDKPLFRQIDVEDALEEDHPAVTLEEALIRGDFGG